MHPLIERLSVGLYRLCAGGFPRDLRAFHGHEMVEAFRAMLDDRRGRGSVARARFVVRACGEVLFEGLRERVRRLRGAARRWTGGAIGSLGTSGESFSIGGSHDPRGGSPLRGNLGGVGMMLRDLFDDVRQAVRGFGRSPVGSVTLILTLALGIGANTAVFSVLNGVLFAPLPYDDPGELVTVGHELTNVEGAGVVGITGPDLLDYIAGAPSAEAMGSVFTLETNLSDDQGAARVTIGWVTPDFFPMLGTKVVVGRMLEPSDWTPRTRAQMEDPSFQPPPMPVMIAHGIWRSRFGSDPSIIGRSLVINGTGMNVVGVLPPDFRLYLPPEAGIPSRIDAFSYLPIPMTEGQRAGAGGVVVARIADGATPGQLVEELEAVNAGLHETWPDHARFGTRIVSSPLLDGVVGPTRALLWVLFGAIGLVLLVAVANVANLLLVRASMRRREFAVRAALGVGRGRIVRQVLTESAVLAVLGAGSGLALAWVGVDLLVALAPVDIPRLDSVGIDMPVLLFTLAVTLGAAVLFGIVPALNSSKVDGRALVSSRGQVGPGRRGLRLRNALIVGELALSVVLVAGAGLLLRSFDQLGRVDPGFEPAGALAVEVALPFFTYRDLGVRQRFFRDLRSRALEIPGVEVAGISPGLPLTEGGGSWLAPFAVAGGNIAAEDAPRARYRTASEDYFLSMGTSILDGRGFEPLDVAEAGTPGSEVAVIVDETFARQTWPGQSAVGQSIDVMVAAYIGQGRQATGRVIGVVESMRHQSLAVADDPTIWIAFDEYAPLEGALVLRGPAETGAVAAAVRQIVFELDPGVPLYDVRPLTQDLAGATASNRYALLLLSIFALTALLLAAVGLYGVVSTSVQQRTREIGVRLALGAEASGIGRMVLAQGARIVLAGVALGVLVAALASPVLESLLFQVAPFDPLTLTLTVVVLGAVALFAGWLPAFRASRMDPVNALRAD